MTDVILAAQKGICGVCGGKVTEGICWSCGLPAAECICPPQDGWQRAPGQPSHGAQRYPFEVIDLEPAAEVIEAPELAAEGMLYRGGVHTLTGPPDCGKTTLACWWMLQEVRAGGRVLFLDEEGGREVVAEKFQSLGAQPGERIAYVPFPGRTWTDADARFLA